MKGMTSRDYLYIIKLIKERYVLCQSPSLSLKGIFEANKSNLFQELSDTNQFFIVISLNPITKYFPSVSNIRLVPDDTVHKDISECHKTDEKGTHSSMNLSP